MKTIVYFQSIDIHLNPPCVAQVCALNDAGFRVVVFTNDCSDAMLEEFRRRDIPVHLLKYRRRNPLLQKAIHMLRLLQAAHRIRTKYWSKDAVLWIGSETSLDREFFFLKRFHPQILSVLEFYETPEYQKKMKRCSEQADVLTACEAHRAQYMKDWWGLEKLPYVLPNKPYFHPRTRNLPGSTPELREAIRKIEGKNVILFQGGRDAAGLLPALSKALLPFGSKYCLVLTGTIGEDLVAQTTQSNPNVLYLGFFPAPSHLEITSHARIGVAAYPEEGINTRYCAPNKTYEYTGFGIPVLCNLLPGLIGTIGEAGAGVCVDFHQESAIREGILELERHYDEYSAHAAEFYEGTDNAAVMQAVVEDAFSRRNL